MRWISSKRSQRHHSAHAELVAEAPGGGLPQRAVRSARIEATPSAPASRNVAGVTANELFLRAWIAGVTDHPAAGVQHDQPAQRAPQQSRERPPLAHESQYCNPDMDAPPQGLIVIFHGRYLRCSFTRLAEKQTSVAATY
jgi:hypothetical protein